MNLPNTTQELRAQLDDVFTPPFDPKFFRALVEHCSEAQRIFLCRQLAASQITESKQESIRILLEFGDEGLRFELRHVIDSLTNEELDQFIIASLQSKKPDFQSFALGAITRRGMVGFAPTLFKLWKELAARDPQSAIRNQIASALASFGTPTLEAKLVELIKTETDPATLQHLLDISLQFRKAKRYEQYLAHPVFDVRFAAARGLSITARKSQRSAVLQALNKETEPRILEMLMKTALRIPDQNLAGRLLEMSISVEDPEQKNLATLHFRQLPDEMIYQACVPFLSDPSKEIRTFALTEVTFLELPQIPELLTSIAEDTSEPLDIRSTAIEGLINHNDIEIRASLFNLFLDNQENFDFSYAIILSLSKMWQEEDVEQISYLFELEQETFAPHLQVALKFINRRLRAQKWSLHERYIESLYMFLDSENLTLCILAMEILDQSETPVEVPALLSIFTRQLTEELEAAFRPIFAAHVLDDIDYFFNWMDAPVRTDAQQLSALQCCERVTGDPDQKARFFCRLIRWPKSLHDDFSPVLRSVFDHLLSDSKTRQIVKNQLQHQPELTPAFLQNTYKLTVPHLQEIGEDFLIDNVESLSGNLQQMCCDALTRMQTKPARRRLMQLFISNEALKDRISLAMRRLR